MTYTKGEKTCGGLLVLTVRLYVFIQSLKAGAYSKSLNIKNIKNMLSSLALLF
jgi:hypothetical protein